MLLAKDLCLAQFEKIKQKQRLKCRIGLHVYKWSWRHLRHECIYCGKKKGGK